MTVYAKTLSRKWTEAFKRYESLSGFEPMFQEDIDSGEMTPGEAWHSNVVWLRDMLAEVINISTPDFEEDM